MTHHTDPSLQAFIARWHASGAAERANYQLFLAELCAVLEVPAPDPTSPAEAENAYVFEKAVPLPHGTTGRIDLYRRGCFVLEAKQGSDRPEPATPLSSEAERQLKGRKRGTAVRGTAAWDTAMARAHQQAQSYARNLPVEEVRDGRPPFLIVVDVGQSIALYAEFSRSGGNYIPFPDPAHYRISLDDLADAEVRALLAAAWLDPLSLDPARRSARVTREIADRLARLAQSLEPGHAAAEVAGFLMRCLFTMFAEDVSLLPKGAFTQLLADSRRNAASFPPLVEELWRTMASGGFSVALRVAVPHFNGGLFEHPVALPLTADQLQLLIEAAQADWRDVEPAIFGTLLVRALDPAERHKLGAHFTPRTSVERLVLPTIIEPLRAEWEAVQTAALLLAEGGKGGGRAGRGPGLPAPAGQHPDPRSRVRFGQLSLCHPGTSEAAGRRGAGGAAQPGAGAGHAGAGGRDRAARAVLRHRGQPVGRGRRRAGAVDRLPAVAPAHPRRRGRPARADPAQPAQHRVPRRGAGVGRGRAAAGRRGPARDPLGRPDHQAAPGDRRARAR